MQAELIYNIKNYYWKKVRHRFHYILPPHRFYAKARLSISPAFQPVFISYCGPALNKNK